MEEVRKLEDPQCTAILLEELRNLFIGQSFDLHWTRQGEYPSEAEYLEMVSQSMFKSNLVGYVIVKILTIRCLETGGLFRLLARLMSQCAASMHKR